MSLSDNYPDIRPVWMNDYANAGVIDPRCSFTRSDSTPSNVHYWSDEDHLSSENLWIQSDDLSNADNPINDNVNNLTITGGQTGPTSSITTAVELKPNTTNTYHRAYTDSGVVTSSGQLTISLYAKASGYKNLTIFVNGPDDGATFDLTAASVTNDPTYPPDSTSITQVGSTGWYRCTLTTNSYSGSNIQIQLQVRNDSGDFIYAGDGTSAILVYGSQINTGANALDYQPTTTQIHREYAATLKPVSYSGQPRFEYEPTGDRGAKGLLIEGQGSNIMPFSTNGYNASNAFVWSSNNIGATENAAVAPSGNLEATLIREDGTTNQHNFYRTITATAAPYTYSIYVKDAGVGHVGFRFLGHTSYGLTFNLSDGSTSALYNGVDSYGFEDVGNGWKRIWVTKTLTAASWHTMIYLMRGAGSVNYAGDNYSGVMWYGAQIEQASHPSSYIDTGTSGSTSSRTADSLSMTDSSLFDTGSGSLVVEAVVKSLNDGVAAWLGTDGNNYHQVGQFSSTTYPLISKADGVASAVLSSPAVSTGAAHKVGASWDTNDFAACVDGGTVVTDTSGTLPAVNKLTVGNYNAVAAWLDGHIKRIAFYPEALTDTELQSLTS